VFVALGSGKTVKTIAMEMVLSPKTVSTYRTRIFHKMRFTNSSELIRYAVLHELVS
jgi:DNA-binding NarL/FixJ family response regulator